MRNALVVFQFTVSVVLIIGTLVVYRQLRYIQDRNLGFNRDQVVIIHKVDLMKQFGAFKQELLSYPAIASASGTSDLMGASFGDGLYVPANRPEDQKQLIWRMWADPDFLATYRIGLAAGTFFPAEIQFESRAVVLNEAAVKILSLENPVGQLLIEDGESYTVIGVTKDFHLESLHHPIKPFLIRPLGCDDGGSYLSVRIATTDVRKTLSLLEQTWKKYAGSLAFEYEFFDEHFARVYLAEQKTGRIFMVFSLLAVFIACLGLLGLTAFIIEQRTKEIGIRKVLGASTPRSSFS
jgi:putative ABC transport system permease protein